MNLSVFSVFFEEPFWVATYELQENSSYLVAKIFFGAEPKDYEVYDFFLKHRSSFKFSPALKIKNIQENKVKFKRLQREIKKTLCDSRIGTKAQQALNMQRECSARKRKISKKLENIAEKEKIYIYRKEKHKQKRRGH